MKFKTHNDADIDTNYSHRQGQMTISYSKLVKVFGEGNGPIDDYKSDAGWDLEFEDGTIATIYNYKNGKNYCGSDGLPVRSITLWNIGGFTSEAVERIREVLDL